MSGEKCMPTRVDYAALERQRALAEAQRRADEQARQQALAQIDAALVELEQVRVGLGSAADRRGEAQVAARIAAHRSARQGATSAVLARRLADQAAADLLAGKGRASSWRQIQGARATLDGAWKGVTALAKAGSRAIVTAVDAGARQAVEHGQATEDLVRLEGLTAQATQAADAVRAALSRAHDANAVGGEVDRLVRDGLDQIGDLRALEAWVGRYAAAGDMRRIARDVATVRERAALLDTAHRLGLELFPAAARHAEQLHVWAAAPDPAGAGEVLAGMPRSVSEAAIRVAVEDVLAARQAALHRIAADPDWRVCLGA